MSEPIQPASLLRTLYNLGREHPNQYFEDSLVGFRTSPELRAQEVPFYVTGHLDDFVKEAQLLETVTIVDHANSKRIGYRIVPSKIGEVERILSSLQTKTEDWGPAGKHPNLRDATTPHPHKKY